ncbi:unnamed protein product [Boreogadus saida]
MEVHRSDECRTAICCRTDRRTDRQMTVITTQELRPSQALQESLGWTQLSGMDAALWDGRSSLGWTQLSGMELRPSRGPQQQSLGWTQLSGMELRPSRGPQQHSPLAR